MNTLITQSDITRIIESHTALAARGGLWCEGAAVIVAAIAHALGIQPRLPGTEGQLETHGAPQCKRGVPTGVNPEAYGTAAGVPNG